jgi:acyl-CoA reductase-like NAD-dependent aldehyde dehydrogenase
VAWLTADGGSWYRVPAMTSLIVDDPFTLEPAYTLTLADDAAVGVVLDRARAAQRAFRGTSVAERVALCERAVAALEADAPRITLEISRMMGKPVAQAENEVRGMASRARYLMSIAAASLADIVLPDEGNLRRRIRKEPLGVVLDLPAWNYPLLTAVNVVIPAILAGNAVVVKHSPRSPLCGEQFAVAFATAGAPPGLVQALHCDHPTSERTVGDARVDHVVFTGSVYGGHRIQQAAAGRFIRVGLELGGNDAAYVAADADLQAAVEGLVDGAIYNAGQSCCAVERAYVHESLYEEFLARAEVLVRAYVLGDPRDAKTSLGPIAQPNHPAELEAMVVDATGRGARLLAGGHATKVDGRGRFFEATLLRDVPAEARLMKAESFGPILPVAKVASDDEALARMNDSSLGLTASVWTRDAERAARLGAQLEVGTVYMNRCDALDPALPWSGAKDSGRGVSLSVLGFDELTRVKALNFRVPA